MYKKCENCYKDGKTPDEESCKKCEDDLKAKEQECEELKTQYNCYACGTCKGKEDYRNLERHHIGLRKSFDELHKQLYQLKAEKEELKKELFRLNSIIDFVKVTEHSAINKYKQFKQTLTEISKIMKKHCRKCKKDKFYHFQLCCTCKYTEILQKIRKCEVENEKILSGE